MSLYGLAPGGVYMAPLVTQGTVSSYLAFPPFPIFRQVVYFCCTFLRVTSTGYYPAPCSMEPGRSSSIFFRIDTCDCLTYLTALLVYTILLNLSILSFYPKLIQTNFHQRTHEAVNYLVF